MSGVGARGRNDCEPFSVVESQGFHGVYFVYYARTIDAEHGTVKGNIASGFVT